MVYESDFYTTRRPYSRPYVSSYNVTSPLLIPTNVYHDFDDETKDIRARADSLLRRIHVFVPRPTSSDFADVIVPERMRSDDYIRRIINARSHPKKETDCMPWYSRPETRHMGDGHLACVAYVGGKPHSRRRPYYTVSELRRGDVRSDVNLLSYYLKNRQAAEDALKKQPDDETIRLVQEYVAKKAEEARLEEERKRAEEEVRMRIIREREAARIAKALIDEEARIKKTQEHERLQAIRQAEEEKIEAARRETERIEQEEKMFSDAVAAALADEEERISKEKLHEEALRRQENEERLVIDSSNDAEDNYNIFEHNTEDHSTHEDVSDQEKEELPYEVNNIDHTEIEEEPVTENDHDELEAGECQLDEVATADADCPQVEETSGGERAIEDCDLPDQPEFENTIAEEPQVEVNSGGERSIEHSEEEEEEEEEED